MNQTSKTDNEEVRQLQASALGLGSFAKEFQVFKCAPMNMGKSVSSISQCACFNYFFKPIMLDIIQLHELNTTRKNN